MGGCGDWHQRMNPFLLKSYASRRVIGNSQFVLVHFKSVTFACHCLRFVDLDSKALQQLQVLMFLRFVDNVLWSWCCQAAWQTLSFYLFTALVRSCALQTTLLTFEPRLFEGFILFVR